MIRLTTNAAAAAILLTTIAIGTPAMANSASGTVKSYDRVSKVLVMIDKSVYALDGVKAEIPASLSAGDKISIEYDGDEDGITSINSITILSEGDQG